MTQLFGRSVDLYVGDYRLTGLDCAFQIEKSIRSEPNQCTLKVWNLAEESRASFEMLAPRVRFQTKGVRVRLEAGYGDDRAMLWYGELRNVVTEIDGPDWVTTLDSGDGYLAYGNSRVNLSYGGMTKVESVFNALVAKLGEAGIGAGTTAQDAKLFELTGIGKFYPHGTVLSGSTADELDALCRSCGLEWSIQDGVIQVLDRKQSIRGQALLVSADSGMIGSPSIDRDGILTVKTLLIPDVRVGSLIRLEGARAKGDFRLEKATWSGDTSSDNWEITMQARKYPSDWDRIYPNT